MEAPASIFTARQTNKMAISRYGKTIYKVVVPHLADLAAFVENAKLDI
jgi:hypothetical protein